MRDLLKFLGSCLCAAFVLVTPGQAAEPLNVQDTKLQSLQKQFTIQSKNTNPSPQVRQQALTVNSSDSLSIVSTHTDMNAVKHVRMQQNYAGFMVLGGYVVVHSPNNTNNKLAKGYQGLSNDATMNGVVYQGLVEELGSPPASFVLNKTKALDHFKQKYAGMPLSDAEATPLVFIDNENKAHWAYKVTLLITHTDAIPEKPTAIVDALSDEVLTQWNDIKTERGLVKGKGFGGNNKTGMWNFDGLDKPYLELTRDGDSTARCFMENKDVMIVNMRHKYSVEIKPMQFECKPVLNGIDDMVWTGYEGDGFDRWNGSFSPSNDALYAGYVIKHMYSDWFHVNALVNSDNSPMQLIMRVHYGKGYENAFWYAKQMTFGDGGLLMYPLVSLGVAAHEISHGFTEQHSGLIYYGQSGGINESFSDMAAQVAEFYSTGKNSWMIGAEIMKEDSGHTALRYMDWPKKDGLSINTADEFTDDEMDTHYSSGVFNRLFYLMSQQEGWDVRKAFGVMLKANIDYWTPDTSFNEASCGILSAAKDLGYADDLDAIKKSLDLVVVDYHSCA